MNFSFRLKYPNKDTKSLIFFTASFKDEGKTFVYSTGEKIHPILKIKDQPIYLEEKKMQKFVGLSILNCPDTLIFSLN